MMHTPTSVETNDRLKIVIVCVSLRGGGTERIVTRLANYLAPTYRVSIVTLSATEPFYALDDRVGIKAPPITLQKLPKPIRLVRQLSHVFWSMREIGPKCCLVFGEDIATAGAAMARAAGVTRTLIFPRGTPSRSLVGVKGLLNNVGYRLASKVVVQTDGSRKALARRFTEERLEVIANPIEIPNTCRPIANRERLIVNVGSIGRLKNQEGLLRVFSRMKAREDWRLVFVGDGPDRKRLEDRSAELGLQGCVDFVGTQPVVFQWLDRAGIFGFSSLSEGFPNALAEAMAAGCACISYDCPTGPSELIDHGVNGFLVEPGDEAEYARLLQQLIDDADLREEFSRNARESMKRFEASKILGELEQMIESVIEGERGVRLQAKGSRFKKQGNQ